MIGMRDVYDELDLDSADALFPKELSRFFSAKRRRIAQGAAAPVSSSSVSLSSLSSAFEARAGDSRLAQLNSVIRSLSATATSLQPADDRDERDSEKTSSKDKDVKEKDGEKDKDVSGAPGDDDDEEEPASEEFSYDDDDDDSGDDYTAAYDDGDDGDDDDFAGDDDDEGGVL